MTIVMKTSVRPEISFRERILSADDFGGTPQEPDSPAIIVGCRNTESYNSAHMNFMVNVP
jgi:hypothetical protein